MEQNARTPAESSESTLQEQMRDSPQLAETVRYLESKYGGRVSDQLVGGDEDSDVTESIGVSASPSESGIHPIEIGRAHV